MSRIFFILVTASAPLLLYARHSTQRSKLSPATYIVSLVLDRNHKYKGGSGSLISAEWVLSAAHCMEEPLVTHIQYGNITLRQPQTVFSSEILERIQHPGYRKGKYLSNDIGLFRVTPVLLEKYGLLSAVDYSTLIGRAVEYTGYGGMRIKDSEDRVDRIIQIGNGIVISCDKEVLTSGPHICLAAKCADKSEINWFDNNGGPLIYDGKIAGIVSRTKEITPIAHFTALSPFIKWITNALSAKPKETDKEQFPTDI